MRHLIVPVAVASGFFSIAPAAGQTISGADPAVIAEILRSEGYKAEVEQDESGPLIRSASSGTNFMILFYNCTEGKDCTTIQYYVGFDMKDGAQLDLVNRWNADMRFGRAYIDDEKDPRLEMDVNLDKGGVSRGNFLDNFSVWLTLLDSFKKHIGWS